MLSGLVSGSETAFFSLSPSDIGILSNGKHPKDQLILDLRKRPKTLLATILIGNNFINVAIVILSTYLTSILFNLGDNLVLAFVLQVIVITSIILLFGEIIPKIYANKEPVMVANIMVRPIKFLIILFKPLSYFLVHSTRFIDKKIGKKGHNITYSELSDAIEITVDESAPAEEKNILRGIATFGEKEASEIMQSRVNVTAIDQKLNFQEVLKVVVESGFSRIPVYEESFDHVIGVLYIKDLLPHLKSTKNMEWLSLIRPAIFIPENKKINDLLQEFREKKIHLAIVVDEYGGTSGLITLEDIIEEIVGEISDEFDKDLLQFKYRQLSNNSFLFEAKTPINDLCKILNINIGYFDEVRGESDSIGGLILELEGEMPEKGRTILYNQFEFEVVNVDQRKINEVKVKINKEEKE
ncbi:MAG: gliding motility-associated protein GldE [Bacteroidetes bacterium]|nr:gliding motility-associated protein GldE [Bacteroidota bacterium]